MSRIRLTDAMQQKLRSLTYTCFGCDGAGAIWVDPVNTPPGSCRERREVCEECLGAGEILLLDALFSWEEYDDPVDIVHYARRKLGEK